jgi:hypothetical protein
MFTFMFIPCILNNKLFIVLFARMLVRNKQFIICSVRFSVMKRRTGVESYDRKGEQGMGWRVHVTVMSA